MRQQRGSRGPAPPPGRRGEERHDRRLRLCAISPSPAGRQPPGCSHRPQLSASGPPCMGLFWHKSEQAHHDPALRPGPRPPEWFSKRFLEAFAASLNLALNAGRQPVLRRRASHLLWPTRRGLRARRARRGGAHRHPCAACRLAHVAGMWRRGARVRHQGLCRLHPAGPAVRTGTAARVAVSCTPMH